MVENDGLVAARLFDGEGGGTALDWDGLRAWTSGQGFLWVHLDRAGEGARRWLERESGLPPLVRDALLTDDTRPRAAEFADGLIVILRGVNLNPGADPEDMVSIRLWIDGGRVISIRLRRLMAVEDIRESLDAGRGPKGPADFLVALTDRLVARMDPVIDELEDAADTIEERVVEGAADDLRARLGDLRRTVITLRRYLAPQREVIARLAGEPAPWIRDGNRLRLRETADRLTRYVEVLDEVRERGSVTHDELTSRLSEQTNRNMYVLSVVAAVFLPLGLITGLLGINVGGIPGTDSPWAFAIVCGLLVVLGGGGVWVLKRLKWI